jgi:proline iminopeptidase
VTESFVEVNGCRTWTAVEGSGPPVLLLHGGPGLYDYLGPIATMLSDRYTVYRYDQRGGGRTERARPYDLATLVADTEALRRQWMIDRARIVGHSFGATLALLYALAHPDRVERLVLWCGTGVTPLSEDGFRERMASRLRPGDLARLTELLAAEADGAPDPDGARAREFLDLQARAELADAARAAMLPVPFFEYPLDRDSSTALLGDRRRLIASGALDRGVRSLTVRTVVWNSAGDLRPDLPARGLAALLPDARFESLADAGHYPWVEQPATVRDRLRALLA